MNQQLQKEIIKHIFAKLGIIPAPWISSKIVSVVQNTFLLPVKFKFSIENQEYNKSIWGCRLQVHHQPLSLLLFDLTLDKQIPEFMLVCKFADTPSYGLYLHYQDLLPLEQQIPNRYLIAYSTNDQDWVPCHTFLQATLLAGLEQAQELAIMAQVLPEYQKLYSSALSFLQFQEHFFDHEDQQN